MHEEVFIQNQSGEKQNESPAPFSTVERIILWTCVLFGAIGILLISIRLPVAFKRLSFSDFNQIRLSLLGIFSFLALVLIATGAYSFLKGKSYGWILLLVGIFHFTINYALGICEIIYDLYSNPFSRLIYGPNGALFLLSALLVFFVFIDFWLLKKKQRNRVRKEDYKAGIILITLYGTACISVFIIGKAIYNYNLQI